MVPSKPVYHPFSLTNLDISGSTNKYTPGTIASLLWKLGSICRLKGLGILFKGALAYTGSDIGEKQVHGGVVVDLEERPCKHFPCRYEVVDICSVVGLARVAGTVLHERSGICFICRGPEIECQIERISRGNLNM